MSIEIEQKYRVPDHDEVAERLRGLGAVAGRAMRQEDLYLGHPARDFATSGEAFRIRSHDGHNALTYKGPRQGGPTKTREETEVAFASGDVARASMMRLMTSLGFRSVLAVKKTRTPYHLDYHGRALEVVLDEAEGLGTFVEVETIVADDEPLEEAQDVVISLARALGLTEVEPRSYLRMALERHAAARDETGEPDREEAPPA